jgi:hypothetical protein
MASGGFAAQPRRPRRPPARRPAPPEPHTEQFAAVVDEPPAEPEPVDEPPALDGPPAGLANWRKRRRKDQVDEQLDETQIGAVPTHEDEFDGFDDSPSLPPTAFVDPGPPTRGWSPPAPFAPGRGQLQHEDVAPRGGHPGAPAAPGGHDVEDEYAYDDEYADDLEGDLDHDLDGDLDHDLAHELDEYGDEYADEYTDEPHDAPSAGKQWLALAGQLAGGVVGGAAVWLGFNWLWVNLPAAALVAALVVVVGLVWIVRKIRRAEDLQTTVLAVLVGLVVTVSPAALLLLSR